MTVRGTNFLGPVVLHISGDQGPALTVADMKPQTCATCKGFGAVRAAGPREGKAYYTENGARTAVASKPCPDCRGYGVRVPPEA